jgi:hypothetical protein
VALHRGRAPPCWRAGASPRSQVSDAPRVR